MLNRKALVSIIALVCCADMAFGAATLRTSGTQSTGGSIARAGTLRTGSVKLAGVTPKASVSTSTRTPTTIGRLATATGGASLGNSHGKISGHGSGGASASALDEIKRQIDSLSNDYDRLDNQYDRLSNDVNYAATTATSANTGINNLRTRIDAVEVKINGLENQGVDTDTINSLIDHKITDFVTSADVATEINAASEALMDYADSVGMTEAEHNAFNSLSSLVENKLDKDEANVTYATKEQLNNAVIGSEANLADYATALYVNATFATKPEVSALSEQVDSAASSINTLGATVASHSQTLINAANKDTELENAITALDNAVSDKISVDTYNNLTANVSAALNNKLDKETFNTYTDTATQTFATKEELDNVQSGNADLSAYVSKEEFETYQGNVTGAFTTVNAEVGQNSNKITTLETSNETMTASINALQLADEAINTAMANKVDADDVFTKEETTNAINTAVAGGVTPEQVQAWVREMVDEAAYVSVDTYNTDKTDMQGDISENTSAIATLQSDVTTLQSNKADASVVAENTAAIAELNTGLSNKVNMSTLENLTDQINAAFALKANASAVESLSQSVESLNNKVGETNVAALAEQVSTNTTNISANAAAITSANSRIDTANENIATLQANTLTADEVQAKIDAAALSGNSELSSQQIEEMVNNVVTTNMSNYATQSDLNTLAARVHNNESAISTINSNVATMNGKITEHTNTLTTMNETLTTAGTNIANLQTGLSTANTNIGKLESDVGTLSENAATKTQLQTAEATLTAAISTAQAAAQEYTNTSVSGLATTTQLETAQTNLTQAIATAKAEAEAYTNAAVASGTFCPGGEVTVTQRQDPELSTRMIYTIACQQNDNNY